MIRSRGLAVLIARPKLSSLLIGSKSLSRGSTYEIKNSMLLSWCKRSTNLEKFSKFDASARFSDQRRNSASNYEKKRIFNDFHWTPAEKKMLSNATLAKSLFSDGRYTTSIYFVLVCGWRKFTCAASATTQPWPMKCTVCVYADRKPQSEITELLLLLCSLRHVVHIVSNTFIYLFSFWTHFWFDLDGFLV